MKRRQMPAVLRFYKSNKDTNPLRFFLQELVLFVPFGLKENGDMQNLLQEPDDKIVLLYEKYSQHIKEVKRQVLPFLEDVMEERFYVEEIRRQLDVEEIRALGVFLEQKAWDDAQIGAIFARGDVDKSKPFGRGLELEEFLDWWLPHRRVTLST